MIETRTLDAAAALRLVRRRAPRHGLRLRVVGQDRGGWPLVRLHEVSVNRSHPETLTLWDVEDVLARRQAVEEGRVYPSQ
ncbi:hypothetical protein [Kineococcus sp. SYSU DK001]|uniref:hypothetical protein n=1 Tax=Kineococcus sp. SYSU DK001 TaxID=3383122 RepID=UPI003D7E284E